MRQPTLRAEGLRKRYKAGNTLAVSDVSFSVPEGTVFGLLGPNGAGKTTTISILCGVLRPDEGKVEVDGMDLWKEGHQVRRKLGVVPQEIALFPSLTVRENLSYIGNMQGIKGKPLQQRVLDLCHTFGMTSEEHTRVERLSGGMKRRVNLMAGIIHHPKLLILDEPTVGIDVHSRQVITDHLLEMKRKGTTLLYTSHDLEEAQKLCDHVMILEKGREVAKGTPSELVAKTRGTTGDLRSILLELVGPDSQYPPNAS